MISEQEPLLVDFKPCFYVRCKVCRDYVKFISVCAKEMLFLY